MTLQPSFESFADELAKISSAKGFLSSLERRSPTQLRKMLDSLSRASPRAEARGLGRLNRQTTNVLAAKLHAKQLSEADALTQLLKR